MADKRMLILPGEVVQKIDENRGDLSQAEFIELLIDNQFKDKEKDSKYATKDEVRAFQEDRKKLLHNYHDFYVGYDLELGKQNPGNDITVLELKPFQCLSASVIVGRRRKVMPVVYPLPAAIGLVVIHISDFAAIKK